MKDYYQILEITPDASADAIKEQYRFLVQAWHPDKFPNPAQKLKAEEKLKEINEAYETLCNPAKREDYDSRFRYTRSDYQKSYREKATPRQSEDERRNKEEAARRAKEEQLRREKENRERAESEKHHTEEVKRQRINQLDQEITLLNQEVNKLSKELPKIPNPILSILFIIGGLYVPTLGTSENASLYLALAGASIITGIVLLVNRNKFYRENYKPAFDKVEKQRQRLQELNRERLYLKNTR